MVLARLPPGEAGPFPMASEPGPTEHAGQLVGPPDEPAEGEATGPLHDRVALGHGGGDASHDLRTG